jgi:hypothetical protein
LELGHSIFGGLLKAADQFDFAVFVFDADDITYSRKKQVRSVRNNVVFELGLFTGRMGRGRTFWISSEGPQAPHIPTDLGGIVHLTFKRPKRSGESQLRVALEEVCQRLRSFPQQRRSNATEESSAEVRQLRGCTRERACNRAIQRRAKIRSGSQGPSVALREHIERPPSATFATTRAAAEK